jgi:hypothetical protein
MQGVVKNREIGHTAFFMEEMPCEEVTWSRDNSGCVVTGLRAGRTWYKCIPCSGGEFSSHLRPDRLLGSFSHLSSRYVGFCMGKVVVV